MNQHISEILSSIDFVVFESVAKGVLTDKTTSLIGRPQFTEIITSHNDLRTIGIIRVTGDALSSSGKKKWSAVAKIVDPTLADKDDRGDVTLDNEQSVYELGLFIDDDVPLRPANCYLVQRVDKGYRILWIEDLTDAPQPPWDLDHFIAAADHLGQFAGYHLANRTQIPFGLQQDWFLARFSAERIIAATQTLLRERESDFSRAAYRNVPIESAEELAVLFKEVQNVTHDNPHCLSFGDSHSRNMFPLKQETVGIDWGFVGSEPIGADVGVLIGSALTYTVAEAQMIAAHERSIFDSYVMGLRTKGWDGDEDSIRMGFFCQFGGYLWTLSTIPVHLRDYSHRRDFVEGRFGVPFEDVPKHVAPVLELIPKYVEELKDLLASTER